MINNAGEMSEPSVEGNIVVFDCGPDAETRKIIKCIDGIIFDFTFGSVELVGNRKIFKNENGSVYKIEKFDRSKYEVKLEWFTT